MHNGLTDFGKGVVREMNRQGIMVDISHVGRECVLPQLEPEPSCPQRLVLAYATASSVGDERELSRW
jgi:microsomal dipeptidase-like Zn-dependent dipeptidase